MTSTSVASPPTRGETNASPPALDRRRERLDLQAMPFARPAALRFALALLLAAVAVFHIAEGVLVLVGVCSPPAEYGPTAFGGLTAPMLLVAVVVGGSALLASVSLLAHHARSLILAAGAGATLVVWEVADVVVARHFSAFLVAVGLGVIALAEYLAARQSPSRDAATPQHTRARVAMLFLEWFIAIGAIDGGLGLLRGALDEFVSVVWLEGTPFTDYTVPGLILVLVVGGSALIAAASVFVYRKWALYVSGLAGLIMSGFLAVEAVSIDGKLGAALLVGVGMQVLYAVPAVVIVWLARSVWLAEYGPRHAGSGQSWSVGTRGTLAATAGGTRA